MKFILSSYIPYQYIVYVQVFPFDSRSTSSSLFCSFVHYIVPVYKFRRKIAGPITTCAVSMPSDYGLLTFLSEVLAYCFEDSNY